MPPPPAPQYPPADSPGTYAAPYQVLPQSRTAVPPPFVPPQPITSGAQLGDDAIAKAQKHAKWAISALNFDDVQTAVQELRGALETLRAG